MKDRRFDFAGCRAPGAREGWVAAVGAMSGVQPELLRLAPPWQPLQPV